MKTLVEYAILALLCWLAVKFFHLRENTIMIGFCLIYILEIRNMLKDLK